MTPIDPVMCFSGKLLSCLISCNHNCTEIHCQVLSEAEKLKNWLVEVEELQKK